MWEFIWNSKVEETILILRTAFSKAQVKSEVWEKGMGKRKYVDGMRVTRKNTREQEQNYIWLKLEQTLSNKEYVIKENKTMLQFNQELSVKL